MSVSNNHVLRYPVPAASAELPHESLLTIKRSRFLARSFRCESAEQVRLFVRASREKWPDASHNCWAFLTGAPGDMGNSGSNDDGEPKGTAGRPMLTVLSHCGIGQIALVVTRWFGGTKLGVGGLVRAYQESARENLSGLPVAECVKLAAARLELPYSSLETTRYLLASAGAKISSETFGARVELAVIVPEDIMASLKSRLAEIGTVTAVFSDAP